MKNIDLFKLPIAHRGITSLKRKILPNTLESCKLAIEKKTPIEIDVRITKDKDLILMHGLYILLENHELKHYKELEKNDINNKYISDSKCKIPRLEDVLKVIDGSIPILIDIKCESFFLLERWNLNLKIFYPHILGNVLFSPFGLFLK